MRMCSILALIACIVVISLRVYAADAKKAYGNNAYGEYRAIDREPALNAVSRWVSTWGKSDEERQEMEEKDQKDRLFGRAKRNYDRQRDVTQESMKKSRVKKERLREESVDVWTTADSYPFE